MLGKWLLFIAVTVDICKTQADTITKAKDDASVLCESSSLGESFDEKSASCEKSSSNRADQIWNPERKMKIAIIGGIGIGHITPTLDMTSALKSKGHEVVYYAPIYTKNLIESTSAKFISYPEQKSMKFNHKEFILEEGGLQIISMFGGYTNFIMPWLLENLKNGQFDIIIYPSFALWGYAAASYLKISHLCVETSMWPIVEDPWIETHYFDAGKDKQLEFADEFQRLYNTTAKSLIEMLSCSYANKVVKFASQKLLEAALGRNLSEPEKHICLNSLSPQMAKNFINEIKENSIIYLSLGTAFNNRPDIFESIITVFSKTKYELIVSTGNNENLYQTLISKNNSNNVKINLFVNQSAILKDVAVFITHAGFNSIKEAISNTIPTITIPQGADQFYISKAVTNLKIGVSVEDYKGSFEDQFKAAFQEIEEHFLEYKENIKNALEYYFDGPSFEKSIEELEDYLFSIASK